MTALIIVYVFGVFFVGTCLFWVVKGKTLIIDRTDKGSKVTPKENEE